MAEEEDENMVVDENGSKGPPASEGAGKEELLSMLRSDELVEENAIELASALEGAAAKDGGRKRDGFCDTCEMFEIFSLSAGDSLGESELEDCFARLAAGGRPKLAVMGLVGVLRVGGENEASATLVYQEKTFYIFFFQIQKFSDRLQCYLAALRPLATAALRLPEDKW